jgi:hypothetical protein
MLDVSFETLDGRTLLMQRYTEPQEDQKLLLSHLKLELPPQKPPKIYRGQLKKCPPFGGRPTALKGAKTHFWVPWCESWVNRRQIAQSL